MKYNDIEISFQCEDKIRQLEARLDGDDASSHVKELEEELKMAKEVCHGTNSQLKFYLS